MKEEQSQHDVSNGMQQSRRWAAPDVQFIDRGDQDRK